MPLDLVRGKPMRPVDKGGAPVDGSGVPIQFHEYQEARGYLLYSIGHYYSYCERFLGGDVAVEHVQPKSKVPSLALDWNNLLLACKNCNSNKGSAPIVLQDYFWADQDNTFRAFE